MVTQSDPSTSYVPPSASPGANSWKSRCQYQTSVKTTERVPPVVHK